MHISESLFIILFIGHYEQARSYHYAKKPELAHNFVKIHIFQTPYGWVIVKKCHVLSIFVMACEFLTVDLISICLLRK